MSSFSWTFCSCPPFSSQSANSVLWFLFFKANFALLCQPGSLYQPFLRWNAMELYSDAWSLFLKQAVIQLCLFLKHFPSWISAIFSVLVIPTAQNRQHRGSKSPHQGLLLPCSKPGCAEGWYKDSSLRSMPFSQGWVPVPYGHLSQPSQGHLLTPGPALGGDHYRCCGPWPCEVCICCQ